MIKNVFDWVKEINGNKREWNSFSNAEQELFNSYVIHRVLSMNPDFIEVVNEVQSLPPSHKKQIYSIYREFIPKNNKWFKYIKSNTKELNPDLMSYLKSYFKVSIREIKDYLNILDKNEIQKILTQQGLEIKEIKKLLK